MATTELQLWDEAVPAAVLVEVGTGELTLAGLEQRARSYEASSKSANTWRAYRSDLRHFGAWCERHRLAALPAAPDTVRLYLVEYAGRLAVSTLRRRLSAISEAHQAAQLPNPTGSPAVRFAWEGMRRTHGTAPRAKEAAVTEVVAAMVAPLGSTLLDTRDRALLLVGFAGALRRSELSALDVADIAETGDGLRISVGRSKTDQEGQGGVIGVAYGSNPPTCPVRAWRSWLDTAGIDDGPAFRRFRNRKLRPERLSGDGIARMLNAGPRRPAWPPSCSAATRCGRALPPRRPGPASPSTRSCGRDGGPAARPCAATSKKASCSWTTPRPNSDCKRRRVSGFVGGAQQRNDGDRGDQSLCGRKPAGACHRAAPRCPRASEDGQRDPLRWQLLLSW